MYKVIGTVNGLEICYNTDLKIFTIYFDGDELAFRTLEQAKKFSEEADYVED